MIDLESAVLRKIKRANTDWWIHEQAVVAENGKTYIGYVTDTGEIHVKEMDAKCSRAVSRDVCLRRLNNDYADEHNAPGLCVLRSGHILVVYTGHGRKQHELYYRITQTPYDIYSFGPEQTLSYEGGTTYAQLFENTVKNEIWLFCRVAKVNWQFRYSADGGKSWSEPKNFLHSDDGIVEVDVALGLYYERKGERLAVVISLFNCRIRQGCAHLVTQIVYVALSLSVRDAKSLCKVECVGICTVHDLLVEPLNSLTCAAHNAISFL